MRAFAAFSGARTVKPQLGSRPLRASSSRRAVVVQAEWGPKPQHHSNRRLARSAVLLLPVRKRSRRRRNTARATRRRRNPTQDARWWTSPSRGRRARVVHGRLRAPAPGADAATSCGASGGSPPSPPPARLKPPTPRRAGAKPRLANRTEGQQPGRCRRNELPACPSPPVQGARTGPWHSYAPAGCTRAHASQRGQGFSPQGDKVSAPKGAHSRCNLQRTPGPT
jgi:hypothetical protein